MSTTGTDAGKMTRPALVRRWSQAGRIPSAMTENQRESFRIGSDAGLEAELLHQGRAAPCTLDNLSAGGAKLTSELQVPQGAECMLRLRLGSELRPASDTSYASLPMEVLERDDTVAGTVTYRLRSTSQPGSAEYEAATKLVLAAQRLQRAQQLGTDEASPMASDDERRAKLRVPKQQRFSKGSLRPDQ